LSGEVVSWYKDRNRKGSLGDCPSLRSHDRGLLGSSPEEKSERRKKLRRYETTFVIHPDLSEEDHQKIVQKALGAITQSGGEILQLQDWGVKKLAYKIKKQTRGHYIFVDYAAKPEAVREVERLLRIDDNVLRFLTVLVDDEVDVEEAKMQLSQASRREVEEEEAPALETEGAHEVEVDEEEGEKEESEQ
jgi:small subunit ribosomal protein S6